MMSSAARVPWGKPTECWSDGVMGFPRTPIRYLPRQTEAKAGPQRKRRTADGHRWTWMGRLSGYPRSSAFIRGSNPQSAIRATDKHRLSQIKSVFICVHLWPIRNPQSAIRNSPSVSGQTQSNPVKPGQTWSCLLPTSAEGPGI